MRYIAEKHTAVTCTHVALRFRLLNADSLDNLRRKTNKNTRKNRDGEGLCLHVMSGVAVTEQMYLFENFPGGGAEGLEAQHRGIDRGTEPAADSSEV